MIRHDNTVAQINHVLEKLKERSDPVCGLVMAMNKEYDAIAHASATAQNPSAAV